MWLHGFALLSLCLLCHPAIHVAVASPVQPPGDLEAWLIKTRRDLHRIPELGFQEFLTSKYIRGTLDALNITYQ